MASKSSSGFTRIAFQGICVGCHRTFIGKGDRCQDCAQRLRERKRRRRR